LLEGVKLHTQENNLIVSARNRSWWKSIWKPGVGFFFKVGPKLNESMGLASSCCDTSGYSLVARWRSAEKILVCHAGIWSDKTYCEKWSPWESFQLQA
jgi:hypothetical protein